MAQHHALRVTRRARSVGDHCDVSRPAGCQFLGVVLGMIPAEGATQFHRGFKGHQQGIVVAPEAARIIENYLLKLRQLVLQRQNLVDLLLILCDDNRHLGVIQHVYQF